MPGLAPQQLPALKLCARMAAWLLGVERPSLSWCVVFYCASPPRSHSSTLFPALSPSHTLFLLFLFLKLLLASSLWEKVLLDLSPLWLMIYHRYGKRPKKLDSAHRNTASPKNSTNFRFASSSKHQWYHALSGTEHVCMAEMCVCVILCPIKYSCGHQRHWVYLCQSIALRYDTV